MNDKISDKDKFDWENFLSSDDKLPDKESLEKQIHIPYDANNDIISALSWRLQKAAYILKYIIDIIDPILFLSTKKMDQIFLFLGQTH